MKVYSVEETTKILKTNKNTVYALINKKMLVALKLKSLKVPEYAIEEFFRKYQFMDLSNLEDIKAM
ncbi:helix-turn-helix domain-containing protein [Clostridium perfringens]|uniref:helix-turn-helix domain-containing protein n=1 Tax=Clostridium perfringens TaxID=1502 RepID=UPI0013E2F1D3|nr:helix-turn-helix domain-containing protein [Clostridium perfringens]MDU2175704.1 helix-turn-helix domain-containing protein [Clostridioides difficile]ELC8330963.1 helix-turn-helix domain-containing protein [Clostridium perfringens]MDU2657019.1 helix-turn-helix domain-containing protein [Clostridium perfringens]MDU5659578.1 helix-turn-helix domain-containing protein [Clostridium perfringens]MDZ5021751.1 helix-turn-helix domain-containing protein [Clostridium perfringens]